MSVYCHCMQYAWIHLYIISALFKIKLYGFVVILEHLEFLLDHRHLLLGPVLLPAHPDLVVVAQLVDVPVPDHAGGLSVVHHLGALGAPRHLIGHVN